MVEEFSPRSFELGHQAITHFKWRELCDSLGATVSNISDELEYPGQVFEEIVVVADPSQSGIWLEMTHETAIKILTLGLP